MCAKKAGLDDTDAISMSIFRQALDIYINIPTFDSFCMVSQEEHELQLTYNHENGFLNLWCEDAEDGVSINLDMQQVDELINELVKFHKKMAYIKLNNLGGDLMSILEEETLNFNCNCC